MAYGFPDNQLQSYQKTKSSLSALEEAHIQGNEIERIRHLPYSNYYIIEDWIKRVYAYWIQLLYIATVTKNITVDVAS